MRILLPNRAVQFQHNNNTSNSSSLLGQNNTTPQILDPVTSKVMIITSKYIYGIRVYILSHYLTLHRSRREEAKNGIRKEDKDMCLPFY